MNNNWLEINKEFLQNKKINDIILPGTINSFSFNPKFNMNTEKENSIYMFLRKFTNLSPHLKSLFESWVKHQEFSIYDQLMMGIRVLDIQVTYYKNKWFTSNILLNNSLDSILKEINKFLKENPKEFIIIKFSVDTKNVIELTNELKSSFWEYIKTNYNFYSKLYQKSKIPTYKELLISKKNIIIIVDNIITSDYQYLIKSDFRKSEIIKTSNLKSDNVDTWQEESIIFMEQSKEDKKKFLEFNASITISENHIINDIICTIFDFFIGTSALILFLTIIWLAVIYKKYDSDFDTFVLNNKKMYYSVISLFVFTLSLKILKNSMKYRNFSCKNNSKGIEDTSLIYQKLGLEELLKDNKFKKFSIINTDFPSENFIKLIIRMNFK